MATIKVDTAVLAGQQSTYQSITKQLEDISSRIGKINQRLTWEISSSSQIHNTLVQYSRLVEQFQQQANALQSNLSQIKDQYEKTETGNMNGVVPASKRNQPESNSSSKESNSLWDEFWKEYGWSKLLSGAGYIGKIYNLVQGAQAAKSWKDYFSSANNIRQFLSGAAKEYQNYKKIGRAVGNKTAMTWWAKSITGLKPLGRASAAKNPIIRFKNNLTNKTSPFHAQFKDVVNNFKGANGVGKAIASWGAVAATGVANWFSNKEEQSNSGGMMSNARVVAETVTETAVDTALTYGASIVVGAAVTTALGTVAAPGVVVVAASGALIAGLNVAVNAVTGKSATEWVSDTILDTGAAIGRGIKSVAGSIGSWFSRKPKPA